MKTTKIEARATAEGSGPAEASASDRSPPAAAPSPAAAKQTRSLAVLSWLVAAAAARASALGLAVAPEFLTEGGAPSLFRTGSVRSLLSRPVLSGGVFVMELICRLMVMMLALLLCCTPSDAMQWHLHTPDDPRAAAAPAAPAAAASNRCRSLSTSSRCRQPSRTLSRRAFDASPSALVLALVVYIP